MDKEKSMADRAEELSSRRARMFPVLAIIFLAQQASYITDAHGGRPVDHVKVGAWVVMSLALLLALYSGGGWLRGRAMREMLNDESSRVHRANALGTGFVVAMVTAIGLYVVNSISPMTGREAIHSSSPVIAASRSFTSRS